MKTVESNILNIHQDKVPDMADLLQFTQMESLVSSFIKKPINMAHDYLSLTQKGGTTG